MHADAFYARTFKTKGGGITSSTHSYVSPLRVTESFKPQYLEIEAQKLNSEHPRPKQKGQY